MVKNGVAFVLQKSTYWVTPAARTVQQKAEPNANSSKRFIFINCSFLSFTGILPFSCINPL
jgi:hypothetical protein